MTVNTGSVTTTSNITGGTITLKRIGKLVILSSTTGVDLAGNASAGATLFTLPTGYRPGTGMRFPCTVVINNDFLAREFSIATTGACSLQGSSAGSATRMVFIAAFTTA